MLGDELIAAIEQADELVPLLIGHRAVDSPQLPCALRRLQRGAWILCSRRVALEGVAAHLSVDVRKALCAGVALGVKLAIDDRRQLPVERADRWLDLADVEALDGIGLVIVASAPVKPSAQERVEQLLRLAAPDSRMKRGSLVVTVEGVQRLGIEFHAVPIVLEESVLQIVARCPSIWVQRTAKLFRATRARAR